MDTEKGFRGRWKPRSSHLAGAAVLLVAGVLLAAAGCGSSSSSNAAPSGGGSATGGEITTAPDTSTVATDTTAASGGTTLELAADPSGVLEFDKTTLEAPAGEVTIVMTNDSPVPHDIAIEGNGVDVTGETVSDGGTSTVNADLAPGTYTFYCTVDGHEDAGMKGTLTVS